MVFGSSAIPLRAEWTQTPFSFGSVKDEFSYGLKSPRNATRGLLSVVQGFILKHLIFGRKTSRAAAMAEYVSCRFQKMKIFLLHNTIFPQSPLQPSAEMQSESLISALVDILRSIADKSKIIMVLPSPDDEHFVEHSATYFHDGITEKVF